jgi:hypothetical protein
MSWEEHRRAPRTVVDVEARLHLAGQAPCQGVIQDLSFLGSLFVPEHPLPVQPDGQGQLRFALPTAVSWLEPHIEVRRITTYTRPNGQQAQAIAFEFSGLSQEQERAIAAGCHEWDSHRSKRYPLSARCFVESDSLQPHFARYGRLIAGSRTQVRISLPAGMEIERGMALRLKVGGSSVSGGVEQASSERAATELEVRLEGWGRDFFLHEARRAAIH